MREWLIACCFVQIVEVVSADTFKRPIYAGNAIQTVTSTDTKKVITVRTASFLASSYGDDQVSIESAPCNLASSSSTLLENRFVQSDRPELSGAKVIVSGGRGFGITVWTLSVLVPLGLQALALIKTWEAFRRWRAGR